MIYVALPAAAASTATLPFPEKKGGGGGIFNEKVREKEVVAL